MPKIWDIDNSREDILLRLHKAIQSVNLNFLIGSEKKGLKVRMKKRKRWFLIFLNLSSKHIQR
jgi:hypothetical protein